MEDCLLTELKNNLTGITLLSEYCGFQLIQLINNNSPRQWTILTCNEIWKDLN